MKITGKVTIEQGRAVLHASDKKKLVLVPYPHGTDLPQVQMESGGIVIFAYLNGRTAQLRGHEEAGHLFNARVTEAPKKIRDVALAPEKKEPLGIEVEKYFKRDAEEIARAGERKRSSQARAHHGTAPIPGRSRSQSGPAQERRGRRRDAESEEPAADLSRR